jgi:hypothetical protein
MPRLYCTPTQFQQTTAFLAFAFQVAQLSAIGNGALDQLLARASRRVDAYCRKRIGAPGSTTVGTGGIAAGGVSLPVASTLGFDGGQEQAVIIGTGGTQETLPVLPGGVSVSSWTAPYPGTITLASPVSYSHLAGETVQGCYQEVSTVGSSGSADTYSESLLALNQAAQLARAHMPQMDTGGLTRVIFLKCYPIVQLFKIEHMLPIDTTYETLDASQVGIAPSAGYLRLPIGSFVLPEGLFRTTYTAGFASGAASWYAADELQTVVSQGAVQTQQSKQRATWATTTQPKSLFVQRAEELLDSANLKRRT